MKFLKFVSCCGVGSGAQKEVVTETTRRREETTALVGRKVWRKRGRVSGGGGADWKPTLGAISEDNVPAIVAAERAAAQRALKRKSGGSGGSSYSTGRRDSRDTASIANYDEDCDHRRGRYISVFPAFAPTPFMI